MNKCENYIQTYTGLSFDPTNLSPDSISIEDIAHALAHQCRWRGHCLKYFSVAEHCVLMTYVVSKEAAIYALMHDCAEAYMGDCPRPFKPLFPNFREIEQQVRRTIDVKLGLDIPNNDIIEEIKNADLRMLATERHFNLKYTGLEWTVLNGVKPYENFRLGFWTPEQAEFYFLNTFKQLMWERDNK